MSYNKSFKEKCKSLKIDLHFQRYDFVATIQIQGLTV